MSTRTGLVALCLALAVGAAGQQVDSGVVQVRAVGSPGAFTGFALAAGERDVATVLLSSNDAVVARSARVVGRALRLEGLTGAPTPSLGPGSFVEVMLLPGDPYPQVRFHLDLRAFDRDAWERRFGEVPFHFLICSLPGAEVFHQRGWAIGTPVVDDYIQMQAEGFGRQVVSGWSRDWMYAPPIGAYPTAIAGLWNPSGRRYVGYDFHGARLTDNTEKDFGTTYCWKHGDSEQFFALTWPFGEGYINLRYPQTPVECGTHFRLLWSLDMGPDDDPNRFVNEFIWDTYADLLPDVERMSDLSWLPHPFRISGFSPPGRLGSFVHNTGPDGDRWWEPNVHLVRGVHYFSPVDYYYEFDDRASQERLATESRRILELGEWMDIEGDRCFFWQTPLDGGGADFFGPGVETLRHVNGWSAGQALLDYVRNDPTGAQNILPYVDGVLRFTKHILYTRNCYPDVPAAQFAWSATPCVTFCLTYYYHFRDDPERAELAQLAFKLARNMTYRYLAIWPCDNDEMDELDASFLMEPNAGLNWLGCACANEIWVYNIAMLYAHLATGDPIMGHYLRGMLERYPQMFQDQWYATVQDYGHEFTERFGLYKECAQGKGVRGSFGGLWGGFERLIWPLGTATARVVCGEGAAMAFNRNGRHTDIADYRYYGEGECSFTLVPGGLRADPDREFDLTVTFPFFRLRGKSIALLRDGESITLPAERIVEYPAEPSTVTLLGVKLGDTVCVGRHDPQVAPLDIGPIKPREMPGPDEDFVERDGFRMLNLTRGAFEGISRDWYDTRSHAGFEPGIKTLYGVPFLLLDPELTENRVTVPRRGIAFGESPQYLFLLVGDAEERSRLTLYREDGGRERVDLGDAVPVLRGWPPVLEWSIDMVLVENRGRPILSIAPTGCRIFSVTSTDHGSRRLAATLEAIGEKRAQVVAHRATVKAVADLAPLFEPFSGHIGVLPMPGQSNPRANAVVKALHEAGLARHLRFLSKEDLINPQVFNSRNIWIALYLGGEGFYQTVAREGDGEEALVRWLQAGGTLVSLADGPFPFYYDERDKPVVSAPRFGLPISGSGALDRMDTLDVAPVTGWEKPPEGLRLTFHVNPDQQVLTGLPATIPWIEEGDQRWRPIFNLVGEDDVYTPLVTLRDQHGRSYGEAAAMIEYRAGDLAGARVVYVWHSLRRSPRWQQTILSDLLRHLLAHTLRPLAEHVCLRAASPPVIDGLLDDEVWRQAPATDAFLRVDAHRDDGRTLRTTAKLAWDDDNLYVAWECEDPDIWATITERDGNLWEEEVVEVFVDPDGDGRDYYEFEINPLGNVVDLRIPYSERGVPHDVETARKWDAEGWVSAVHVQGTIDDRTDTDTRWTVETAIPLRNFATAPRLPPRVGDVWRAQLYRVDRSNTLPNIQLQAWSATRTFHDPARFGRLLFAANPHHDDFSAYEEGAPPSPTWAVTGGDWQVGAGALIGTNSGTDGWTPTGAVAGDATWTDYRLRVRFQVRRRGGDHRDGAWIGFRYNGPGECYSLNFRSGVQLNKASRGRVTGDNSFLAKSDWTPGEGWHEALITVRGPHITVDVDGARLMDVVDRDFLGVPFIPAGGVCLSARKWSNSPRDTVVAFDEVMVEQER